MKIQELKTGDTILVHNSTLLAKGIQYITKSEYNHAKSVVRLNDEILIYESNILYTKESIVTNLEKKNKYIVKRPIFIIDETRYINSCNDLINRLYDFKGTFIQQLIFNVTKNIFNKGIYPFRDNKKLFYCSEAAIHHYNMSSDIKINDNISPGDIAKNTVLFHTYDLEL